MDNARLDTSICSLDWAVRCVTAIPLAHCLQHVIQSQDSACVEQVSKGCHVTLAEWDSLVSPQEAAELVIVTPWARPQCSATTTGRVLVATGLLVISVTSVNRTTTRTA